jgi:CheY-like chemotaxis protein
MGGTAAERIFGFERGATKEHIRMELCKRRFPKAADGIRRESAETSRGNLGEKRGIVTSYWRHANKVLAGRLLKPDSVQMNQTRIDPRPGEQLDVTEPFHFPPSSDTSVAETALASRILMIDDDRDIRQLCAEMLTGFGYRVDTAEDGEAGWEVLREGIQDPDSYDLLITDYSMRKMSGVDLIRQMRAARITLPVILISGQFPPFIDAAVAAGTPIRYLEWNRPLQISAALQKPFTVLALLRAVKEVMQADGELVIGATEKC